MLFACASVSLFLLLAAPAKTTPGVPTAPASPPTAAPADTTPGAPAAKPEPVILFLIDNSASLPPLDPQEKRVAALEKMFTFLTGQRYRLILFGGRQEIFVDDVSRYRNNGQWTDFYFAFTKAKELIATYPANTEFRLILLTDGLCDPGPADWADMRVPADIDLKTYANGRLLSLLRELRQPLYVILVGDPLAEGDAQTGREQAPVLIWEMVQSANGASASMMAQTLSSFFGDNGLLLKKFVFRVAPNEGLAKVEPVVRRIVAPPQPGVERVLGGVVLALLLSVFLMLGIVVRAFPGPGDIEIVELSVGVPAHLDPDHVHRVEEGGWATRGLSLVTDARDAAATLSYQSVSLDLSGAGLDATDLDALAQKLLPMNLEELGKALERYADEGGKEEKIAALNLDYMGKNFDSAQAERLLTTTTADRRRVSALDFLRAKVHLLSNPAMRNRLTETRVQINTYGKDAHRKDLAPGAKVRIGPYGLRVRDILRGGRKDVRVLLSYEHVPSMLGLKTILPSWFQRLFRLRRRSERKVT
jgi:hypothetical protein